MSQETNSHIGKKDRNKVHLVQIIIELAKTY